MTVKRLIAALASVVCCWAIWQAGRVGFARTLAEYGAGQRRDNVSDVVVRLAVVSDAQTAAQRSVMLLPADAETHAAHADVLQRTENYAQARDEYERAVQLRPRDYYLWMLLGVTRDQNDDQEGALRALNQSVALAPFYAQPRWQLGNLLLRMGQFDQAFAQLRRAAESNPSLWPAVDDLAWGIYRHDPEAVIRAIQPATSTSNMALALFFARNSQSAAALDQFRATVVRSDEKVKSLLDALLKLRAFREAYEIWATMKGVPLSDAGAIRDGGFEGVLTVGETGFGWQITPDLANVAMSIDEGAHQSGTRSLRIDFRGNSNPTSPLLTQIVMVKPLTHYHFGLAALSKDFVSAAHPIITLIDSSDSTSAVLAQSPPLLSDPDVWRDFAVDFTTGADTHAVTITLARQPCANNPCPAFGTVWLDSVSLSAR